MNITQSCKQSRAGFSLIEIALALLVLSVGLLAVLGLLTDSLELSNRSIDDTHIGMFADDVFNGFRALASVNWENLETRQLPPAAPDMWQLPVEGDGLEEFMVRPNAGWRTLAYETVLVAGLLDYAFQYNLEVGLVPGFPDVKFMRLEVVHGQYTSTDNPRIFYTEVFRQRGE